MSTTTTYTDPYPGRKGAETIQQPCGRCGGAKEIGYGRVTFRGGDHGTENRWCFDCLGAGYRTTTVANERKRLQAQARRIAKADQDAQAKMDAKAQARAQWEQANPQAVDTLTRWATKSTFLESMVDALEAYGTLTERQTEAVVKAGERFAQDELAPKVPVPAGRMTVTGTITTTKATEGYQGQTTWKMVVTADEGFKVYGTVPASLVPVVHGGVYEALRGQRVTFTATLEPSDKDETFGWYSRPTKATLTD